MIAAIYARKSTEQERDIDARLPSIERQVEHARAPASSRSMPGRSTCCGAGAPAGHGDGRER